MAKTLHALFEIRLRRYEGIQEATTDERLSLWVSDTPFNRKKLLQACQLANRLHGPKTHWIEERQG